MFLKKVLLLCVVLSSIVSCPIQRTYLTTPDKSGIDYSALPLKIESLRSFSLTEPLPTKSAKVWFGDGTVKNRNKKIRAVRLPMQKSQFSVANQQKVLEKYTDELQKMLDLEDYQVNIVRKVEKTWLVQKFHIKQQNNASGPTVFMLAHQSQVYFYFKKAKNWKPANSVSGASILRQLKNYVNQYDDVYSGQTNFSE